MKRNIFYSWQSDIDSSENRNLIEYALNKAIKSICKDENEIVEPVLDRDTNGISGTPSIADSIFAKITLADLFVADVSIITDIKAPRQSPNPNVLVELGYAVSQLGWNRIVLVQNTEYGDPNILPFDLRGRRVVSYAYKKGKQIKSESRALLQGRLESAIKSALIESTQSSLPVGDNSPIWWGKWVYSGDGLGFGGTLNIREVCASGFLFDLSVHNGGNLGNITAYARIVSQDLAYAKITNEFSNSVGELRFQRNRFESKSFIEIDETSDCSGHKGLGVSFSGTFTHLIEPLFHNGFLNELEMLRLCNLTGEYYDGLRTRFQSISIDECLDDFQAKVFHGGVRGLYTIMEGILIIGELGEIWVAYIDEENILYFTTQLKWKDKLPKTINAWRARFPDKAVIHHKYINQINNIFS